MIDLRNVKPLHPSHLDLSEELPKYNCENISLQQSGNYKCKDVNCRLVYSKIEFCGYPDEWNGREVVVANFDPKSFKAKCKFNCKILLRRQSSGFNLFICKACHAHFRVVSPLRGAWGVQDIWVIKFLILKTQENVLKLEKLASESAIHDEQYVFCGSVLSDLLSQYKI
ncbi:MAG: hypothetical protein Q7S73_02870 [bacterium]|nr:hypothetical protein [bacterium]